MVKESKKCSRCGKYGHNLRTCNGRQSLKLFGVTIVPNEDDDLIRKTKSMGNLAACTNNAEQNPPIIVIDDVGGYATDQPRTEHKTQERRKGVLWNVAEHQAFLKGLEKHGKGDWRSIAKNFVTSRTPTQVASHAQKHFIRQNKGSDKKKRSSLFDMSFPDATTLNCPPPPPPPPEPPRRPPPQFPPHVENSSVGSSSNTPDVQRQALIPVDAAGNFSMPAAYGFPSFGPMPHFSMAGGSSYGQNLYPRPTISFIPVMNFPNHGSICLPNTSLANYPLKLH